MNELSKMDVTGSMKKEFDGVFSSLFQFLSLLIPYTDGLKDLLFNIFDEFFQSENSIVQLQIYRNIPLLQESGIDIVGIMNKKNCIGKRFNGSFNQPNCMAFDSLSHIIISEMDRDSDQISENLMNLDLSKILDILERITSSEKVLFIESTVILIGNIFYALDDHPKNIESKRITDLWNFFISFPFSVKRYLSLSLVFYMKLVPIELFDFVFDNTFLESLFDFIEISNDQEVIERAQESLSMIINRFSLSSIPPQKYVSYNLIISFLTSVSESN